MADRKLFRSAFILIAVAGALVPAGTVLADLGSERQAPVLPPSSLVRLNVPPPVYQPIELPGLLRISTGPLPSVGQNPPFIPPVAPPIPAAAPAPRVGGARPAPPAQTPAPQAPQFNYSTLSEECRVIFGLPAGTMQGENPFFTPAICDDYRYLITKYDRTQQCTATTVTTAVPRPIQGLNPKFASALAKLLKANDAARASGAVSYNMQIIYGYVDPRAAAASSACVQRFGAVLPSHTRGCAVTINTATGCGIFGGDTQCKWFKDNSIRFGFAFIPSNTDHFNILELRNEAECNTAPPAAGAAGQQAGGAQQTPGGGTPGAGAGGAANPPAAGAAGGTPGGAAGGAAGGGAQGGGGGAAQGGGGGAVQQFPQQLRSGSESGGMGTMMMQMMGMMMVMQVMNKMFEPKPVNPYQQQQQPYYPQPAAPLPPIAPTNINQQSNTDQRLTDLINALNNQSTSTNNASTTGTIQQACDMSAIVCPVGYHGVYNSISDTPPCQKSCVADTNTTGTATITSATVAVGANVGNSTQVSPPTATALGSLLNTMQSFFTGIARLLSAATTTP